MSYPCVVCGGTTRGGALVRVVLVNEKDVRVEVSKGLDAMGSHKWVDEGPNVDKDGVTPTYSALLALAKIVYGLPKAGLPSYPTVSTAFPKD